MHFKNSKKIAALVVVIAFLFVGLQPTWACSNNENNGSPGWTLDASNNAIMAAEGPVVVAFRPPDNGDQPAPDAMLVVKDAAGNELPGQQTSGVDQELVLVWQPDSTLPEDIVVTVMWDGYERDLTFKTVAGLWPPAIDMPPPVVTNFEKPVGSDPVCCGGDECGEYYYDTVYEYQSYFRVRSRQPVDLESELSRTYWRFELRFDSGGVVEFPSADGPSEAAWHEQQAEEICLRYAAVSRVDEMNVDGPLTCINDDATFIEDLPGAPNCISPNEVILVDGARRPVVYADGSGPQSEGCSITRQSPTPGGILVALFALILGWRRRGLLTLS